MLDSLHFKQIRLALDKSHVPIASMRNNSDHNQKLINRRNTIFLFQSEHFNDQFSMYSTSDSPSHTPYFSHNMFKN